MGGYSVQCDCGKWYTNPQAYSDHCKATEHVYREIEPRADKCEVCGYPLRSYNPMDTSTWRQDNFCSARCKSKRKMNE
jgi:hypothetical protein